MKTNLLTGFILFLIVSNGFAQIPQSPDKVNSNGQRDGIWTILYNKDWKEPGKSDTAAYYRIVTFLDGKPAGMVRDYYLSGKIQWEGKLKSIDPDLFDDGTCFWYYENGITKSTVNYLNEKPNGEYRENYSDGKIGVNGSMKNGFRDGLFTYFHPNGEIFSKRLFHQDSLWSVEFTKDSHGKLLKTGDLIKGCGNFTDYFRTGKKSGKGNYENGVKEGTWTFYFNNGTLASQGNFVNGLKDGLWKEYERSKGWWQGNYIKGKSEGQWIYYDSDGHILIEGVVKNDIQNGFWKYYDENGDWCEGVIIDGKQERKWVYWYSTYREHGELLYINGNKEGNCIWWYKDGKLCREGHYKNDVGEGFWKQYNEDGSWAEGVYSDGKQEGEWKEFRSDGKYRKSRYYKNGHKQKRNPAVSGHPNP